MSGIAEGVVVGIEDGLYCKSRHRCVCRWRGACCLVLMCPNLGCDNALAESPDRRGGGGGAVLPKTSIVAPHAQRLADRMLLLTALSRAFLRKRWTDVDTVHAGATGVVLELLPVAVGVIEYWGSGRRGAEP